MKHMKFIVAAAASVLLCLLAGLTDKEDHRFADMWYQERSASDGDIVLVEIDQRSLEEIGPFQDWGRGVIAETIEILNQSEDCRPAVIGLDILYAGERSGEEDRRLALAAGKYGNVVTASAAEFGPGLGEAVPYIDNFKLLSCDEPYPMLKETTVQGHINAMYDNDGVLRHALWEIDLGDGRRIPSFASVIANHFREFYGEGQVEKPPVDANGFWYVPFCGRPGDFSESIGVIDVLEGRVPAEYFSGKIVLIGPYAAGLQDSYVTAADHAQTMYGVEYQANLIQSLLWGDYKKEVMEFSQLAVLFFISFSCVIVLWNNTAVRATVLWAAVVGGYLLICKWVYQRGTVLNVLWIPASTTIIYVASLALNYARSVIEKRRVTNTFKRYVAPQIVNEVLQEDKKDSLETGGRIVDIAVLFVDVRGFTSMSEKMSPDQVVEILNQYLALIADCIMRNEGTLDKFIGDAAMAFWGAPRPQEDYVMKAVRAAEDMRRGSDQLSRQLMKRFGRTVSFGIGIHVGEAVVGNIGSPQRMDYTAIGDTVNTASRLESNAPGGTIYISREVADRLKGRIRVTSLGSSVKLKGKAEGFEVLTLDGIV